MADDQDLADLRRGERDMARRDFTSADLSGLDLSNRDFTGAHLKNARVIQTNFSQCDLEKIESAGLVATKANFNSITAPSTVFYGVDCKEASFRDANLARSHFTRTDFNGADLRGADFRKSVINDGCNFEAAIVDSSTQFDDARIFRPLARQPAFRFYRVERGVLVRDHVSDPEPSAHELGRANAEPAHFPEPSGTFAVDYRSHDGRIRLGAGDWLFDTKWSSARNDSIHVYRDSETIAAIGVARSASKIEDVTPSMVEDTDFTSRARSPQVGEVVLAENRNGYLVAIEIHAVTVTPEADPGTILRARYRILTDRSRNFSNGASESNRELVEAIDIALQTLSTLPASNPTDATVPGIGHNKPPPDAALTREDHDASRNTLRELRDAATSTRLEKGIIRRAADFLRQISGQIMRWAGRRLEELQTGFFNQLGATLADPKTVLGGYIVLSGKLDTLIALIASNFG